MAQAHGLRLVDGEWVSMPIDPYHIMANTQQDDIQMPDVAPKPAHRVPEYGILSQTVFATPLNKLILPANIRHNDLVDVVIVGEDYIHLKEIRDHGRICHVATKTDFNGGRIITARVFGQPREAPSTKIGGLPLPKTDLRHRSRPPASEREIHLPPEVVVLTLSNRTLMFLWARRTHTGLNTFTHKTVRLPAGSSRFDRFGSLLAVDPQCRAIAVAAHEGRFILYKTKSMAAWEAEANKGREIPTAIEDERIISVQGQIMHMDFLCPGEDEYHVVLLLVIVLDGRTRLSCFDWDCRQDLSEAAARTERYYVQKEDTMPSLLIPLRRSPDFLLVFDEHISVYKNILSGDPACAVVPIDPSLLIPLLPGDSKLRPKWTAWDKTLRNPGYPKEGFYLAREDGRIIYLVRGPAGTVEMDEVGEWSHRIDTAFACLQIDNSEASQQYPDFLIAGGASNDGLLCKVGPWLTEYSYNEGRTNSFSYIDSIPNWTPLTDFAITKLSTPRGSSERQRASIFVANGNSPHGEISELRHGVQAIVDDSFNGVNGCAGVWVVDHGSHLVDIEGTMTRQHYAILTITLPPETLVIRIVRTQPECDRDFSGAWELGSWDKFQTPSDDDPLEDSLARDEETISACPWARDVSIQITRKEARTLLRPTLRQVDILRFETSLLLAASRPAHPFIAIVFHEQGCIFLEIVPISDDGTFDKTDNFRQQLPYDPTCVEILEIGGTSYVFVSTFDCKIMLFKHHDRQTSLVMEGTWDQGSLSSSQKLCESVTVLSSNDQYILVGGMRDGTLLSSTLEIRDQSKSEISCISWTCTYIGTTPAKITHSETDVSSAFVSCGSDFCRVRYPKNGSSDLEIDCIWFTDRTQPDYNQSPVSALYQLPFFQELDKFGRNLGGFLFIVAGDRLLFSQLESDIRWAGDGTSTQSFYDSRMVPRKMITGAKPTSILYMQRLRRVVVSTMEAKESCAPPHGERVLHSSIKLLEVREDRSTNDVEIKQEDRDSIPERLVVAQFSLQHAERVYTMVEWQFVTQRDKKYSLIIVGTGIQVGSNRQTGRRLIFNTGRSGSKLELQKQSTYDQPVYSIALWDNKTTVGVTGKTLFMEQFYEDDGRWTRCAWIELPSPGIHVSVERPYVYVSTLQHSHMCFQLVDRDRPGVFVFIPRFSDSGVRNCSRHLVMDVPNVSEENRKDRFVLVTDKKSSSVTALYHPPEYTYSNASETLFEACLPRAVVRIDRGDIRPPWRRANPSSKIAGVLADDIFGACTDGTIFAFSILSQSSRYLLRLVQNLIEVKTSRSAVHQHDKVKPRSGDIFRILMNDTPGTQHGDIMIRDVDPRHLERASQRGPRHKHVDGDLLKRWLSESAGDIRSLVCDGVDTEISNLFEDLARGICDEGRGEEANGKGKGMKEDEEMFEQVKRWMRDVLMPLL
ncbi:mono-functional DNA-alkylating methyl methanesulfonate N-term-domain-containing protein [Bipolaris maydis]|nr:mono-functional DNA-alkylating methyl methanesulfonate N-term-domain-containing protein [Bipolaris maydis]